MTRSLRLYAPFIALAVAQAAFVLVAPSTSEDVAAFGGSVALDDRPGISTGSSGPVQSTAVATPGSGSTKSALDGSIQPGDPGASETSSPLDPDASGHGVPPEAEGDTSHCRAGRQTDVIYNAPPCAPRFTGDNGGATYRGVTAEEIKLVRFQCQSNEQVNAILATQGLAATSEETNAMTESVVEWMNSTYEFYGRQIVWESVTGDCPTSPPDPAKARQAATEVLRKDPFIIIYAGGGPSTHDVWAQHGVISVGGPYQTPDLYHGRRPFRWDIFPTGFEGADTIAEYYCKKMTGRAAANAGRLIHPQIGDRSTRRKLAIVTPDNGDGASLPAARRVRDAVSVCTDGAEKPGIFTYASDINRAEEQTRVVVAGLIDFEATTVVCMCDAIAPVFLTEGMTRNSYYPEHLLPSGGLLDYDVLGRLYHPVQWEHAFGPSQLVNPVPFEQSDAALIWKASGRPGQPCAACNLVTGYLVQAGLMIQQAGPVLNPLAVENGLVGARYSRGGWHESGGDPGVYLTRFGPQDYNAISDFREVYWDSTARSEIDGRQGAYVAIDGGRRYTYGELDGTFRVPAKPQ